MATEQTMKWLDLSAHGVRLRLFRLEDKSVNLVLTGVKEGSAEWGQIQALGFEPSRSGRTLVRVGTDVQTGALRRIFPRNVVRDIPTSDIWLKVTGSAARQVSAERNSAPSWRNVQGEQVEVGDNGTRRLRNRQGQIEYEGEGGDGGTRYLRADSQRTLEECAMAFVSEMIEGKHMDSPRAVLWTY